MSNINKLIMMIFIFSFVPISTINAEVLKHDEFEYKETDKNIEIIKYTGEKGSNIIIPGQIDNKNVVSIGEKAFKEFHSEKVEFPGTLKEIKKGAFESNNFKNVEFNEGLKRIGSRAFRDNSIEEIILPKSIEKIGKDAFSGGNIKKIHGYEKSYAEEWSNNQGYEFESLDHKNIKDDKEKQSTEPPEDKEDQDKEINKNEANKDEQFIEPPYENKDQDKEISKNEDDKDEQSIESSNEKEDQYKEKETNNNEDEQSIKPLEDKETNKNEGNINRSVKSDYDFEDGIITGYNGDAIDIKIPEKINGENIIEIGEEAFEEKDLNSVKLPSTIKVIGKKAFIKNNIKTIIFPDSLTEIRERAFHRNNIENVTIPKNVTKIGQDAFDMEDSIEIIINGSDGSEAQRYANSEGIEFECLDCDNENDTEKDTSISLNMNKEDLKLATSINKKENIKFDNQTLNYEIEFGKDLEDEFIVQYTVDEFTHADGKSILKPIGEKKPYETKTANVFNASESKVVNGIIELDFLEFDNSKLVKKGHYNSKITTEVVVSPNP